LNPPGFKLNLDLRIYNAQDYLNLHLEQKISAMQNLTFFAKKVFQILLLALLIPMLGAAQTNDSMTERFEQMMRRMEAQMRQGMPFDTTFEHGQLQFSPDSSSFFYFRMDTSFNGMGSEFFDFSPFGSPNQDGFQDFDRLLDQFFKGTTPFTPRSNPEDFPIDDGELSGDDGLLPEERLRQETEKPNAGAAPKKSAKSKVKTIRI
jgi:hypothetical protein